MTDSNEHDPDKVVTHERFAGGAARQPAQPFDLDQLRRVGLVTEADADAIDALGLREPYPGEEVIGKLTADEAAIYVALHNAVKEQESAQHTVGGNFLIRTGEKIKTGNRDSDILPEDVVTPEEVVRLFRTQRRAESLKAILYWQISERLGSHDWVLSVRSKSRVVRIQRKW
jgi:hypothetical protein